MALNDLERRNSPYFAFFSPNSIALQADYVTVVEDNNITFIEYWQPRGWISTRQTFIQ